MFTSILVPLDGSSFGEYALPTACSLGRASGATLHLVHVHMPVFSTYIEGVALVDPVRDARQRVVDAEYLAATHDRLMPLYAGPIQEALLEGAVSFELERYADTSNIDLIVMSTHGRGGFARFWLGSTADLLIRQLHAPMLLIRPRAEPPDLQAQVAFRRIVVPLDGSAHAEQILASARAVAAPGAANILLLHVIDAGVTHDPARHPWTTQVEGQALQSWHAEAERYLERVAQRLAADGLRVSTRVVADAPAATAICDMARAYSADLIALATHGLGGVRRLVIGSVADKIVRASELPVLLLNPRVADMPTR